ncbi:biotin carboxylase [Pseudomonas syringae pv. syringae]|nr:MULTISPECIES: biotin carboxylase [Pseudomonas syringae group]KWS66416.1 biotin carboxylase [Pseudomonas amygdali pv. morsprunorum]MCH5550790.1 biotin carboxylase [Pseudomonas syringae pv. syringae]POC81684.1 biotin carboxylase [Pseudomonas avellanae]POC98564.1 biotin carboxylase [Pseudomonas avellanae]
MSYLLCLHRWVGRQALYDQYGLPAGTVIRAICTPESLGSLPAERLASSSTLPSLDDVAAVMAEVDRMIQLHGVPQRVVALNEGDLLSAAAIRERWAIPGDSVAWIERFRDKLTMFNVAGQQSAIAVLPAVAADDSEAVCQLLAEHGYPLVLKPRFGTASRGVRILRKASDLALLQEPQLEPMMVQVFCAAPILHVDGWWDGEQVVVLTASRYVNSCADFGPDSPLGSIELEAGAEELRIASRVAELLAAFAAQRGIVFHLELFDDGDDLYFLEIGARVGGAEIPFLWREVRDIDLVGIAWELQTEASSQHREHARSRSREGRPLHGERGAWIIGRRGSTPRDDLGTLYWSQPQDVERAASGVYEGARTRLRLRSFDRQALVHDVETIFQQLSDTWSIQS